MKLNLVQRNQYGFTLVEILVAMALMAIIGTLLITIFANTLRGSNKAKILADIKQTGQSVSENMIQTIKGADRQICSPVAAGATTDTIVLSQKDIYTRYRIIHSGYISSGAPAACISNPLTVQSNGCIIRDNPVKPDGVDPDTFRDRACNSALADYPMDFALLLTNPDTQTGVKVDSNSFFKVERLPGSKTTITINFQLGPGAGLIPLISDQIDPVQFQTTVQIRNDLL